MVIKVAPTTLDLLGFLPLKRGFGGGHY